MPVPASGSSTVRLIRRGTVEGSAWGLSPYSIFEASTPEQAGLEPYLLLWLHGGDGGSELPTPEMAKIHKHMDHRMFFFMPQSPKPDSEGRGFYWGVRWTKRQNKSGLGYIFGDVCDEYLESLARTTQQLALEVCACKTIVSGYSMGGFGAYQLGGHVPEVFDVVIAFAGYGIGTTEAAYCGCDVPQPESREIFNRFLERFAPRLAKLPLVLAVHSPADKVSSYEDTRKIIAAVRSYAGNAKLICVPEEYADSDPSRKKKAKWGHSYYNSCLLNDTSDTLFYDGLKAYLSQSSKNQFESELDQALAAEEKALASASAGQEHSAASQAGRLTSCISPALGAALQQGRVASSSSTAAAGLPLPFAGAGNGLRGRVAAATAMASSSKHPPNGDVSSSWLRRPGTPESYGEAGRMPQVAHMSLGKRPYETIIATKTSQSAAVGNGRRLHGSAAAFLSHHGNINPTAHVGPIVVPKKIKCANDREPMPKLRGTLGNAATPLQLCNGLGGAPTLHGRDDGVAWWKKPGSYA